jgi:adenine-specific DNA-methyltransferase
VVEADLLATALGLGARSVAGWSDAESALCAGLAPVASEPGADRLGEAFCALRPPEVRRASGATYTPGWLVEEMLDGPAPARVVDPGTGSGRFLVAAGRRWPDARLVGIERDPVAAVLARGNLAAAGLSDRAEVRVADFRAIALDPMPTLFLGNPPYVRHHGIEPAWKAWLTARAAARGLRASQLAGLHVHFLLAIADLARPGDRGCLVTAAEWLDVGYGGLARALLAGPLGLTSLRVLPDGAFPDAMTTAVIIRFEVGYSGPVRVGEREVPRDRLGEPRWSGLGRSRAAAPGTVARGELFRVHRGQVTGHNRVWVAPAMDLPDRVLFPCVTRAAELFAAPVVDPARLRRVVDLPRDLDALDPEEKRQVEAFLAHAGRHGADAAYVARARRPWWSVGLREPAPILATYMARRPPAFVRNPHGARHLNIAHGLYPRAPMAPALLDAYARWLSARVALDEGRTYAGGLTKFEPREMERLRVPPPEDLAS